MEKVKRIDEVFENEPNYRLIQTIITIIVIGSLIWSSSVIDFSNYTGNGGEVVYSIIKGILTPDKTLLFDFSGGVFGI